MRTVPPSIGATFIDGGCRVDCNVHHGDSGTPRGGLTDKHTLGAGEAGRERLSRANFRGKGHNMLL